MVVCLFVSDLHGKKDRFQKLFKVIEQENFDSVFIGGDILPRNGNIKSFLNDQLFSRIEAVKKNGLTPRFFVIMGNDDPRKYEELFIAADHKGVISYIHNKVTSFGNLYVAGYAYVPPTPFLLKDWERFDVSQYVDIGAISPLEGVRTTEVDLDTIRYATIADDLQILLGNYPPSKMIFLFHSPPYNTSLDRAALDDKIVDHVAVDVHVGSIAIQQFIQKHQPLVSLHGHVHESGGITGEWMEVMGKTYAFSAAYDGPGLAVIRFDTDNLHMTSREVL